VIADAADDRELRETTLKVNGDWRHKRQQVLRCDMKDLLLVLASKDHSPERRPPPKAPRHSADSVSFRG
jgi:hypothetical protein